MEELNLGDLVGLPYGSHKHYSVSFEVLNPEECNRFWSLGNFIKDLWYGF